MFGLLPQCCLDLSLGCFDVQIPGKDFSISTDQEHRWQREDTEFVGESAVQSTFLKEMGPLKPSILEIGFNVLCIGIQIDTDDLEAFPSVFGLKRSELFHLLQARFAPGGPIVYDHHLSSQRCQVEFFA